MDPNQLKASYEQTQFLSGKIDGVDKDLFNTQSFQNIEGFKSQQKQTQDILDAQERAQYANENRLNRNFINIQDSIKDQGANLRDTVYRTNAITNDFVNKGAIDNLLATERVGGRIDDNLYRTTSGIDQSIFRGVQTIQQGQTEAMRQLETDVGQIQLESQKSTNELIAYLKSNNDHNWSNFANLTRDVYQGKAETILSTTNQFAQLAKQSSDNAGAIQIEALKNKSDLSKQMAFEYSDLKDKISSSESSIKEVLRSQESDRLRDVLRATENKSLYFELKNNHHHHHHRRRRR
jgi:hypothetical protein